MSKSAVSRVAKRKRKFRVRSTIGTAPGTLLAHESSAATSIRVICFDSQSCSDVPVQSIQQLQALVTKDDAKLNTHRRHSAQWVFNQQSESQRVCWINVDGLSDTKLIKQVGDFLELHPLALEDVVNVHQRAKLEAYGDTLFFVVRMPVDDLTFHTEQISLFLCGNVVLTLQERGGDCLDAVRKRIRAGAGRLRGFEADYLTYAIVDAIVDSYFALLEKFANELDEITTDLGVKDSIDLPLRLHNIRENLLSMRRVMRQQRDALQQLLSESRRAVAEETQLYFRDCLDHMNQLLDATDAERETCAELRELYFAMLGQRNNDVIKLLTIVSTIFIPMSFIAGVYGMNFETSASPYNMPELHWKYGYPAALGAMALVAGGLVWYLKSKRWLR